ncbi:IPT/TIG domain-containing protein [Streptomyces sioyaensis]|uniref:IPT/TIG domain-containing protein n=1 Tax=Streptomyces sioyaensis TaxID=67364 RepID=UPI00379BFB7F
MTETVRLLTPYGPGGLLVSSPGLLNQFSGVFPHQGSSGGGTLVTLIGSHFNNATAVYFGSRPAAGFAVLDDQTIVAVTPAGSGTVPVTVTTPGGTARIGYFYYLYWPALSAVTPAAGPVGGGNVVELRGINLSTAQLVYFGDAVSHPVVLSDARLLVIAPPVAGPGTVPVYVSSIGGVSNRLPYTYAAAPSVTGVIRATGPIAGGSTVILTSTGLSLVTGVSFGALSATSFRAFSDTLIVAVTPAGPPGPADVTVTTPGGSVTVPAAFDYRAPSATAVTSTPDPALVGQPVTFTATVTGVTRRRRAPRPAPSRSTSAMELPLSQRQLRTVRPRSATPTPGPRAPPTPSSPTTAATMTSPLPPARTPRSSRRHRRPPR